MATALLLAACLCCIIVDIDAQVEPCPLGWSLLHGGSCYLAVPGQTSYSQAQGFCRRMISELATPGAIDEVVFINGLASAAGIGRYWVGIKLAFGGWALPNGTAARFTNWRPSQPDGCCGSDVTCAFANYVGSVGQWDDTTCSSNLPTGYICQFA